jgi:CRP-like cAMP-binding protein
MDTPMTVDLDQNQLLRRFPSTARERLEPHFRSISFPVGQILYEQGAKIDYSYFPTETTLSNIVVMGDGSMIEVATVGNEGGVGVRLSTAARISPHRVLAQVPGGCLAIGSDLLEAEVKRNAELEHLLDAYHTAFLFQVSQSVACNGLHRVDARCCRWLLMTHDRVTGDEFVLTHEFLSHMLGVRRSTVTEVLQELQSQGIIAYVRGRVTVLNRSALEKCSCECYEAVRKEYQRLLP